MAGLSVDDSLHAYSPPLSLWSLIESQLPSSELEEIKRVLGESLVEQSIELHQEIELLLDIWRDCRHETERQEAILMHTRLPEPPDLRDRLKAEIKFLVESIRDKAKRNGGDPDRILSRQNSIVLDYALEKSNREGQSKENHFVRPVSALSNGRETPLQTNRSGRVSAIDDVIDLKRNVTLENLETVTQHLQEVLKEEIQFLLQDIEFLQRCIDEEANYVSAEISRQPTLTDLREQRNQLEQELLMSSSINVPQSTKKCNSESHQKETFIVNRPEKSLTSTNLIGSSQKSSPTVPRRTLTVGVDSVPSSDLRPHRPVAPPRGSNPRQIRSPMVAVHPQTETLSSLAAIRASLPTHVTVRTGSLPPSSKLVKVGSIPARNCLPLDGRGTASSNLHPSSSSAANPSQIQRPGSAQRFRNMVIECREND